MVSLHNLQKDALPLVVELAGGGGTRSVTLAGFGSGSITDAEYTQNPDYYNNLVTQGKLSVDGGDIVNQVTDEPANHQIGSAVSGGGPNYMG